MISTFKVVPTNTEEEWYKKILTCGAPSCTVSLYQSKSAEWVRIKISFSCKIINTTRYSDNWLSYQALNVRTPYILNLYPELSKYVTYILEDIPYTTMPKDLNPKLIKDISFVFQKTVLSDRLAEIYESFKLLLETITREEELVANDHLAMGELIESVRVSANLRERGDRKWWDIGTDSMKYPFIEDFPSEYWGDVGLFGFDFIAGTTKYPWMPADISSFDIF
jgi:hypothetical protein